MNTTSLSKMYSTTYTYTDSRTVHIESLAVCTKHLECMCKSMKFMEYMEGIDSQLIDVKKIRVDKLTWFCAPQAISPEKLGFVYMELTSIDKRTGKPIPGVVFLRGNSVVIYLEVDVISRDKTVIDTFVPFTKQLRMGSGKLEIELPAGMCDANGDVSGVAIKEIKEETGLSIPNAKHMLQLGATSRGINPNKKPSIGGTQEEQTYFYCKLSVSVEEYEEMRTKVYGCEQENETILLELVSLRDLDDFIRKTGDMKAMTARYLVLTEPGFDRK